jgi:hypothetical protein
MKFPVFYTMTSIKIETKSNLLRTFNSVESLTHRLIDQPIARMSEWLEAHSAVEFTWHWLLHSIQENFSTE